MARLMSILTLAIFLMLIFSNALVSFSTLYRSREVAYLIQAPLRYDRLFLPVFSNALFSFLVLGVPGFAVDAGVWIGYGAPLVFYAAVLAFFFL